MKQTLLLLFIFLTLGMAKVDNVVVTTQMKDKVIFQGKEYILFDYLLEHYFAENPEKKPKLQIESSALDRGYISEFEIIENQLYLVDIKIQVRDKTSKDLKVELISVFQNVFPETKRKKVDWKTGFLLLPYGELKSQYTYPNTYSNYWVLELKRGNLTQTRNYTNEELNNFKTRQFKKFKSTREYRKLIKCFKKTNKKVIKGDEMDYGIHKGILDYTEKFLTE
ncbi:hypothetical protein [Urechidicola croceus]|uniref:DUF4468 domain-containing protein n=1 Tax=Urechidicola croceus TaxID=1850246 RepID=A0A1D8P477_9FLAO|nr:hypothetical protein [Urechidicola croceus]AOW19357.1 hypothetical protein LPB138_01065 [Urechidicola croceus]